MREDFGEDLDRDIAIQLRVAGAKDLTHTAYADRRNDLVDAEPSADCKGQMWCDYTGAAPLRGGESILTDAEGANLSATTKKAVGDAKVEVSQEEATAEASLQ
ncbi:MAG TPA: hypothetical protein VN654_15965 [Vicinamibacterales bacterium]|nr:hypothetical protein [Vicinamibacterales bacterium]